MSTINSKNVQVGTSSTAAQNFTLYQPATPDGTVRLGVGNSGATTGDVVTVNSAGVTVTGTLTATTLSGSLGAATATSLAVSGASTTGSLAVNGNNISAANSLGFRNRIINGDMSIIQRGTQTGVGGVSAYAVDRWLLARESGSMAARFTISSDALTSSDLPLTQDGLTNCQKIDVTTASGGISAGFSNYLAQRIEGFNIADVGYGTASARPLTLSFWLKTDNKTGVMSVSLYSGSARNYIQTINATTSWQKFTLTFPGDTGGSILASDNAQQMQLMFVLSAGSDFYATTGQWNAGFDNAASTQVDFTDSTANNIYITGVQLEVGSVATPFERMDYGRELIMCQRYYQRYSPSGGVLVIYGYWDGTNAYIGNVIFPVTPRTTPTGIGVSSASNFNINNSAVGNPTATSVVFNSGSNLGFEIYATVASGGSSTGKAAKLYSNTTSAWIELQGTEL